MSASESSDTDSSEELSSSFKSLRGKLKQIDYELSKSIESFKEIRKVARTVEKLTEKKDLHTEYPLLHKYLGIWKKENRLNHNGSKVFLNSKEVSVFNSNTTPHREDIGEAKQFGLKEGWNSVYDICSHLKN
jgi:hypothetical protein